MTDIKPIEAHNNAPLMVVVELAEDFAYTPEDLDSHRIAEKEFFERFGVAVPVVCVPHGTKVHAIPCPAGEKNEALEALRDLYDEAVLMATGDDLVGFSEAIGRAGVVINRLLGEP